MIHRTSADTLESDINYLKDKYKSVAVITRDNNTALRVYENLQDKLPISLLNSVIVYSDKDSKYLKDEKNLLYVACTRAQHELIVYSTDKKS